MTSSVNNKTFNLKTLARKKCSEDGPPDAASQSGGRGPYSSRYLSRMSKACASLSSSTDTSCCVGKVDKPTNKQTDR